MKKGLQRRCFPVNFTKFTEHFRASASELDFKISNTSLKMTEQKRKQR